MYDILTTAAVVDELAGTLPESRIQRIGLRDSQTLAVEVYRAGRRSHLVATIGDPEPALYRSGDPFAVDPGLVTPFSLLLRKYVRGATVLGIDQPPLERIVRLSIAKRFWPHNQTPMEDEDDEDESGGTDDAFEPEIMRTSLYIELMGRRSNIILVDHHGVVMDSIKRVTPKMSRVRPIWPSARYSYPPPQRRADPRTVMTAQMVHLLASKSADSELGRTLIEGIAAMSPAMASEAVWTALGLREAKVGDAAHREAGLADAVRHIAKPLEIGAWSPYLYRTKDGALAEYAAVPFASRSSEFEQEPVSSISEAVSAWQRTDLPVAGRHDGRRMRLLVQIRERAKGVNGRIHAIEKQAASVQDADRHRRWGEAIFAHLWEIAPGERSLLVDGEVIPLDPARPAKETANEYFEMYRRMQRGTGQVAESLEEAQTELAYLEQLETMASLATSFEEIENVMREWQQYAAPKPPVESKKRPAKGKSERLRPITDGEGNLIYIGRTGTQNDRITFELAGPDDYWVHARGVPGSHVIVRSTGQDTSEQALVRAAAVAAWYSKSRTSGKVEVDIARRRDVRKIKGAGPGMVTYRNERTILVTPADESGL